MKTSNELLSNLSNIKMSTQNITDSASVLPQRTVPASWQWQTQTDLCTATFCIKQLMQLMGRVCLHVRWEYKSSIISWMSLIHWIYPPHSVLISSRGVVFREVWWGVRRCCSFFVDHSVYGYFSREHGGRHAWCHILCLSRVININVIISWWDVDILTLSSVNGTIVFFNKTVRMRGWSAAVTLAAVCGGKWRLSQQSLLLPRNHGTPGGLWRIDEFVLVASGTWWGRIFTILVVIWIRKFLLFLGWRGGVQPNATFVRGISGARRWQGHIADDAGI